MREREEERGGGGREGGKCEGYGRERGASCMTTT